MSDSLRDITVCLYSKSFGIFKGIQERYLGEKIRNPDPDSEFEMQLKQLPWLIRRALAYDYFLPRGLAYLQQKGYDVQFTELCAEILGHVGFQRHTDSTLHILSVETDQKYREIGLATFGVERVILYARELQLASVRIGGGKNAGTNAIYAAICKKNEQLGINPREGNWVDIVY